MDTQPLKQIPDDVPPSEIDAITARVVGPVRIVMGGNNTAEPGDDSYFLSEDLLNPDGSKLYFLIEVWQDACPYDNSHDYITDGSRFWGVSIGTPASLIDDDRNIPLAYGWRRSIIMRSIIMTPEIEACKAAIKRYCNGVESIKCK